MDCKRISSLLNAYADRELSKSDQTLVEQHLAECPSCRAELEEIHRLDAAVRCEVDAPEPLRSVIADRIAAAKAGPHPGRFALRPLPRGEETAGAAPGKSRSWIQEKLGMKFKFGIAAIGAAALILVLTMSSGGNAMAAYTKMKKAVTQVTSSHLHLEFGPGVADEIGKDMKSDHDGDKDDMGDSMAAAAVQGLVSGNGSKSLDVWSEQDKWKVTAFGGIDVVYNNQLVTVKFGDKVFASVKADKADIPHDMGDFLFKEMSKATDEINSKYHVVKVGTSHDGGKTLDQLEVTGKDGENGRQFRLEYWVDQDTNLPAKFEVYAHDDSGSEKLVCTITCDYNENYPDSLFDTTSKTTKP